MASSQLLPASRVQDRAPQSMAPGCHEYLWLKESENIAATGRYSDLGLRPSSLEQVNKTPCDQYLPCTRRK